VEYGEVTRIGSSRPMQVDVRIVGATNVDLPRMAAAGKFRADLLDRLSFEVITLPPLRAREGDVPELAQYYGRRMATELGWDRWPGFSAAAMDALEAYAWPGNVRELRNVVERAVYRWDDAAHPVGEIVFDPFESEWAPRDVLAEALPEPVPVSSPATIANLREAVEAHERALLAGALERHRWNQRRTAESLGLTYDQLRHCMKKHGLKALAAR
jgi:psp operon transcriptional activator